MNFTNPIASLFSYVLLYIKVSNIVYSRWSDAYPVLKDKLDKVHEKFEREVSKVDKEALSVYLTLNNTQGDVWREQNEIVVQMLTTYSVAAGDELHKIWSDFFAYLFPRFRDLIIMEEKKSNKNCGCEPSTCNVFFIPCPTTHVIDQLS
jgi:hypothetical protein